MRLKCSITFFNHFLSRLLLFEFFKFFLLSNFVLSINDCLLSSLSNNNFFLCSSFFDGDSCFSIKSQLSFITFLSFKLSSLVVNFSIHSFSSNYFFSSYTSTVSVFSLIVSLVRSILDSLPFLIDPVVVPLLAPVIMPHVSSFE